MPEPTDPEIESLDLAPIARTAAYALKEEHDDVVFTSGRRSREEQADAMAENIVKSNNRQWIKITYAPSTVRDACQKWVDDHPNAKTSAELADGIASALEDFSDDQLGKLSKHLSGMAFDVQPVSDTNGGADIKLRIKALDGLDKFIENEGGLVVWHAQFKT